MRDPRFRSASAEAIEAQLIGIPRCDLRSTDQLFPPKWLFVIDCARFIHSLREHVDYRGESMQEHASCIIQENET